MKLSVAVSFLCLASASAFAPSSVNTRVSISFGEVDQSGVGVTARISRGSAHRKTTVVGATTSSNTIGRGRCERVRIGLRAGFPRFPEWYRGQNKQTTESNRIESNRMIRTKHVPLFPSRLKNCTPLLLLLSSRHVAPPFRFRR